MLGTVGGRRPGLGVGTGGVGGELLVRGLAPGRRHRLGSRGGLALLQGVDPTGRLGGVDASGRELGEDRGHARFGHETNVKRTFPDRKGLLYIPRVRPG